MKTTLLLVILICCSFLVFSQDCIVRSNGQKINCKITKTDSLNVYFDVMVQGVAIESLLHKIDIQYIDYGKSINSIRNEAGEFRKNRIAVTLGASIPFGDFASTDMNNSNAGLAGAGANVNLIYYTHKFTPQVAIGLKWFGNSNTFENSNFING